MRRALLLVLVAAALVLGFRAIGWTGARPRGRADAPTPPVAAEQPAPPHDDADPEVSTSNTSNTSSLSNITSMGPWPREPRDPLPEVRLDVVAGRVVDAQGLGIGGVRVRLQAEDAPERWREYDASLAGRGLASADDGAFRFPRVPAGTYRLEAVVETWDDDLVYSGPEVGGGGTGLEIVLPERPVALPIPVRVRVYLPDGGPLPRGTMCLVGFPNDTRGEIVDGRGEMQLRVRPPPGQTRVWLFVEPDGAAAAPTENVIDLFDEVHEVHLDEPQPLSGTVLLDGEPVAVTVWANGYDASGQWHCRSDALGRFRFGALPRGRVKLWLGPGESPYRLTKRLVVATDATDVVMPLTRHAPLEGRVIAPAGRRVEGVDLELWWPSYPGEHLWSINGSYEDVGAEFRVGALTPGLECEVWISGTLDGGERFVPRAMSFIAGEGPLEVRVEKGGGVRGQVVRPDGSAVAGAQVRLEDPVAMRWMQHQPDFASAGETDAEGRFAPTGIGEQGAYLTVWAPGAVVGGPRFVRGGEEDLRLVLAPELEIRGRVEDPTGYGFRGIAVACWHAAADAPRLAWLPGESVGADGTFTLDRLAPGPYVIYAWNKEWRTEDGRCAVAGPVEAGATDVRLVLAPGATLRGRAVPPTSCQIRVEAPWGMRRSWCGDDGRFAIPGLPPGPCAVAAFAELGLTPRVASETVRTEPGGPPVTLLLTMPGK